MQKDRSRRWQLTENNAEYTKQDCAKKLASVARTTYVISCAEIGESGTKHIHAFVIYDNAIALKSLKKHFPRAHFEPCCGSNVDNREYIVKADAEPYESGSMPVASGSDRKVDYAAEVMQLMLNSEPLWRIIRDYPELGDYVVRNYRSLKEIANDLGYFPRKR